jgi:bacillithiol biosynthesis cysteine-adding enzyme BshC
VVPVFWLASEDHDFQEVRSAWFPGGEGLEQVSFPGEYNLTPAAEIPLTQADVAVITDRLAQILPETEFTAPLLELVSVSAGRTFAAWCGGLLSRLFAQEGLVILDSCGLPVRKGAQSIFVGAADYNEEIHNILAAQADLMIKAGRVPGLDVPIEHSNLFLLQGRQRLGLLRDENWFYDRNDTVRFSLSDIREIIKNEPWRLSPNVVLRPLVQEKILPVLAMVGGPGEMAYLEQLGPVFRLMGMEPPPLYTRMGGLLVEPPIARLLEKYHLGIGDVEQGLEPWLQKQLEAVDPIGIPAAFADLRKGIHAAYWDIIPGLGEVDPQLKELGQKNLDKVLEQVEWLEKRAESLHRHKNKQLQQHIRRLQAALAPQGGQQQRLHNCLWYTNKYGPGFLEILLKQPLATNFEILL